VITNIIGHIHLLNLPIFRGQFREHILIKIIEISLQLILRHGAAIDQGRILIQIGHDNRLTEGGLVVNARAFITMAAGSDFKVKGTIDLILLGTKD